jgi:hypothetical protein
MRLTDDPFESVTSFCNAWCVASSGANVHVVWHDNRDGSTEIYYKRSTDNGETWEIDAPLTTDASWSERPSIALSDSIVHVAWYDGRLGPPRIFYKRSLDNGTNWGADISLTPTAGVAYHPSVAVSDSIVHVVWTDFRAGPQIYYTRSLDNGTTWETDRIITPNAPPAGKNLASVAVSGSIVHVVWMDFRTGGQIYYTRSLDDGTTWETDRSLTPVLSQFPSVAVSDSVVHVVYADFRYGSDVPKIYYIRSLDEGTTWEAETELAEGFSSWYPSVAVSGSLVHVVWPDNRHGDISEIYYKRSLDHGTNWGTDIRLTDNPSESREPSVAVSGSYVHVVWHDDRDGNKEIYYKRNQLLVALDLTPDATTVPRGGILGYMGTVINNTSESEDFQYWAEVTLPNGNTGVLGPWSFSLAPHESRSGHIAHGIPSSAPLGEYTYTGKVGVYPSEVWDQDSFNFAVVGGWSSRIAVED